MGDVYDTIAKRLSDLSPGIKIADFIIGGKSTVKENSNTLDGIDFAPKNRNGTEGYTDLLAALKKIVDSDGKRVFAGDVSADSKHWALKLSLAATDGLGLREIWRIPPSPKLQAGGMFGGNENINRSASYSSQFGSSPAAADISALHVGMTKHKCNIHIDVAGFIMEHRNNISLTPDFPQHLVDELLLKTKLKERLPARLAGLIEHISLIYPHIGNRYTRIGPTTGQVLGWSHKIPVIGSTLAGIKLQGVLGLIPLPGLEIDLVRHKRVKVKAAASCSAYGSESCSVTLGVSGVLE